MELSKNDLFNAIKEIINQSRLKVFRAANSALLESYWQIGKLIVEDEQQGKLRADYGKGFDYTNLTNIRKFYLAFPILDAMRQELSWTHYRLLSRFATPQPSTFHL